MIYTSQQMEFQDISIGGNWFYRCRDKGTKMLNNLVKVTSLWRSVRGFIEPKVCILTFLPKTWQSLETSLPYKLQSVFRHNSSDAQLVITQTHPFQFTTSCGRNREGDFEEPERDAQIFPQWQCDIPERTWKNKYKFTEAQCLPTLIQETTWVSQWYSTKTLSIPAEMDYSSFVTESVPSRSLLIPFPGMQRRWVHIFTLF